MQWLTCFLITLLPLLYSTTTLAAVFKCTSDTGEITFTDVPCATDQKIETIEAAYVSDPRLRQIDFQAWVNASGSNAEAAYLLADWAHRVAEDSELALAFSVKAQRLGHVEAGNLVLQLQRSTGKQPPDPAELDRELSEHIASLRAARSNVTALERDMQRLKNMGTIAVALADYVKTNGRDALRAQLVEYGAFEWECAGRDDCATYPGLLAPLRRSGLAPGVSIKSCAPRLSIPCLKVGHFLAAPDQVPTDFSQHGANPGYEISRVGDDEIWVTSRRAETIEVLSVGITLPDPQPDGY